MDNEDHQLKQAKLSAKPCEKLQPNTALNFNGFRISLVNGSIEISQDKQTSKIKLLEEDFIKAQYIAQRALGAYITTVSQPCATFALSFAAQTTDPTFDDSKFLNKCLEMQKSSTSLKFVRLDL
ncbi:hypothetical protein K3495_g16551 [Podosphaera aphanis]|nr:hypothetical protein K3495_g16551 [Podosphaera aphanis]